MKAVRYLADWDPKPGVKLSEKDRKEQRGKSDSDKLFRNPRMELMDVPKPKIEHPDEVLIEIKACGICGTDCHLLETDEEGYQLYPGHMKAGMTLGHEFCGQVVEAGPEVVNLKVGDKVTVEEMKWCGKCDSCRKGHPNQCTNLEEFGITVDGAYAEYVVSSEKYCWKINGFDQVYDTEDQVWDAGCLCEPSSVAYNALIECGGGFRPGAYVVVFGCGPIGLFTIAHSKNQGAARIIVFEKIQERIDLAKAYGADYVFNPDEIGMEVWEKIIEMTDGDGADIFIEAAGVPDITFPQIEKSMAPVAMVINTAMGKERVPLYLVPYAFKKGRLAVGVGHSGHDNFKNVIRLICAGRFDPTKVITAHYPLEEYEQAMQTAKERSGGKVVLTMNR